MGCLDNHVIREYLDRELEATRLDQVVEHLHNCPICRQKLNRILENEKFVNSRLARWPEELAGFSSTNKTEEAWDRFQTKIINQSKTDNRAKRRIWKMMTKYQKAAVAAIVGLCLIGSLSLGSVRGALADFLTVFRVEKFKTVTISPQDINQIEEAIRSGVGSIDVENFGEIKVSGQPEETVCNLDQAREMVDFAIKTPQLASFDDPRVRVYKPASLSLTLDTGQVNAMIESLGGTSLLPQGLDGKTFTLNVPYSLSLEYAAINEKPVSLLQMKSPELQVPEGVEVEAVREALLSLPFLPEQVRSQLAAINDWRNTVVIPGTGQTSEVSVRGQEGVFAAEAESGMANLFWSEEGIVYCLCGNFTLDEARQVAESMR